MVEKRAMIGLIGDGTAQEGSEAWMEAEALGRLIVDSGHRIVCGGLGGVMHAACRGARQSSRYREGDTVGILPGTDPAEANDAVDVVVPTGLGHARNIIIAQAQVVVAVGGGAGTLSEIAMAWVHNRPIVALELDGWSGRLAGTPVDDRDWEESREFGVLLDARDAEMASTLVNNILSGELPKKA
jgi:uncharacterized protein (TIGR00725 family)